MMRRLVPVLVAIVLVAAACSSRYDARTLHVIDEQEVGGDEPYLGLISFRSKIGVPGSTEASFDETLATFGTAGTGGSLAIPDSVGYVTISGIERSDAVVGTDVTGLVAVTLEHDETPFSVMEQVMDAMALQVADAFDFIETQDYVSAIYDSIITTNGTAAVQPVETATDSLELRFLSVALGPIFAAGGDYDDFVGVDALVLVAGEGTLGTFASNFLPYDLDPGTLDLLPDAADYTADFPSSDGLVHYSVDIRVKYVE